MLWRGPRCFRDDAPMSATSPSWPRRFVVLLLGALTAPSIGYGTDPGGRLDEKTPASLTAPISSNDARTWCPRDGAAEDQTVLTRAAFEQPVLRPEIAPRRQPDRFKLVRAWRAERIAMPGNVVCIDDPAGNRIVALDGWRTVVVLDPIGRELARHELDLPADAAIGFLRTAVDAAGKRWWLGGNRGDREQGLAQPHV